MATSGTRNWHLEIEEVIREAVELAGGEPSVGNDPITLRRSLNLLFTELTNRKINLFTLRSRELHLIAGTATYTLSQGDVDVLNGAIRQGTGVSQSDINIGRMGFDLYAQLPSKNTTGRPTQYFVRRLVNGPEITFWPVPDQAYTFYYWVFQRIEDATASAQDPAVPFRYIPVLTNGLAYHLARKRAAATSDPKQANALEALVARLKSEFETALDQATTEDRERISTFILPTLGTP